MGITAEAITGALAAGREKMDIFGVIIIASMTAIGGGSVRDVLLGHYPLGWVKHPEYFIIVASAAVLTVVMIIPRGGAALHQLAKEHSTIPVIVGGIGVCHMFVEESADLEKALPMILNAKTQRASTCNTLETLLAQCSIADEFLPRLADYLQVKNVKLHADPTALSLLQKAGAEVYPLKEELKQEWLSLDLNVVVEDLEQVVAHIRQYGSRHSDSILTASQKLAQQFITQVDSAAVYVNASTRFTDGGQFGLGAEVAVSTQKLHARGLMGLEALTTYKWVFVGDHSIRS
ncbi:glutamate-5-semialdehyde dehydrogenase [Aggregatibacter actinomycetemcomitans]|nr:glutamate-5-semialdehyde dehydrogenase [Aggregatibacter actinomycetemcomitans]